MLIKSTHGVRSHPLQQHQRVHAQVVPHHPLLPNHQTHLRYLPTHSVRQQQVVSKLNARPLAKRGWMMLAEVFKYSWLYQFFIFGMAFSMWATFYFPVLWVYQANNKGRTYEACMAKEKAFKKKKRELEEAEEAAEAAAEAAEEE